MNRRSENMRKTNPKLERETPLAKDIGRFFGAVWPSGDPHEERLDTIIHDVHVSLRDCAEQRLRQQGAPNPAIDAEEVAQSWIANMLGTGASRFDPKRGSLGYGIRSWANGCCNVWRELRRRRAVSLPDWCVANTEDPCTQAGLRERRAQVRRELRRLPKNVRRILRAKYWFGLRSKEIAVLLKIKVSEVNRLAYVGRRRLHKALGE